MHRSAGGCYTLCGTGLVQPEGYELRALGDGIGAPWRVAREGEGNNYWLQYDYEDNDSEAVF